MPDIAQNKAQLFHIKLRICSYAKEDFIGSWLDWVGPLGVYMTMTTQVLVGVKYKMTQLTIRSQYNIVKIWMTPKNEIIKS